MHLVDKIDEQILNSDIPAIAKCRLFEYILAPDSRKFDLAAEIAYEIFSAELVFAALPKKDYHFEQQKYFIAENLIPSITPIPEKYRKIILYLVTYWNARVTGSVLSKKLLNDLIEEGYKENEKDDK